MRRILILLLAALLLSGCTERPAAKSAARTEETQLPTTLVRRVEEQYPAVSASPDGKVELCVKDGALYIRRDDSVIPVTMNESRGAADTYDNLEKIAAWGTMAIGSEGLVWSPDGRYAAVVNQYRVVSTMQFIYDPIVIDMQTGEMFLLASYSNKSSKEDSGTVLTVRFSDDSRYLYAVLMGKLNGARFSLMQYDLKDLTASVLQTWEEQTYWPHLTRLRDGSFLLLKDAQKLNDFTGLAHITRAEDGYALSVTDFTQRMVFFYPRSMQYSADSGHALILSNSTQGENHYSNLLHLRPDEGVLAPETYWAVPSLESSAVAELVKNELQSPSDVLIHAMRLSPDGRHALLVCSEDSEFALRMLTLADGSLSPLTGVDSDTLRSICITGGPYLDWCGNRVFLGQSAATACAYTLE